MSRPRFPSGVPVAAVAVRLGVLTAVTLAADTADWIDARATDGEGGAQIGLYLLVFAVLALVALVWAVRDGGASARRGEDPSRWVLCWAVVAVLFGVLSTVLNSGLAVLSAVLDGAFSFGDLVQVLPVLASDLASVAPGIALLIGVPALAGLAVGSAVGGALQARRRGVAGPPS